MLSSSHKRAKLRAVFRSKILKLCIYLLWVIAQLSMDVGFLLLDLFTACGGSDAFQVSPTILGPPKNDEK